MPLRPSPRSSVTDDVIAQIESLIAAGEWPVGHRLPPAPELATTLGVGLNAVREAVGALAYGGLLDVRRGDGTYVRADNELEAPLARRIRRADALEALEVRASLERDAAVLAARRRTSEDLDAIDTAHRRQHEAFDARDAAAYVEADVALHVAVVAAAHNALLADLYGSITAAVRAVVRSAAPGDDLPAPHDELVAAVRDGDPDAAAAAVTALLADATRRIERTP
ncbi:FCD domain-containing protein [Patulibacter sp. NPDC049589]|uniref:FadR/GntR family transcriptional regulator n=1 Tax=Patulibacter sp. NPDC049589 TaxID=3154731 RepID=UPI0034430946